jgi:hypothetical protein
MSPLLEIVFPCSFYVFVLAETELVGSSSGSGVEFEFFLVFRSHLPAFSSPASRVVVPFEFCVPLSVVS